MNNITKSTSIHLSIHAPAFVYTTSASQSDKIAGVALVSAMIEEFGLEMPGWDDGRRGDFEERGYFGTQQIRGDNN